MNPGLAPLRFLVYSRAECGLCDEMLEALAAFPAAASYAVDVRDVDADAAIRTRFGHKVPVLFFAGELVCHGHLDPVERG